MKSIKCWVTLVSIAAALNPISVNASDFYKDKIVTAILGAGPGGGYDLYARTVMKHLVNHIPGKPQFIMQFMPGCRWPKGRSVLLQCGEQRRY